MPACPGHSNRSYTASVERRSRPGWDLPTILQFPFPTILAQSKPSRINTCKSASKQTTLTIFRMNTYEKTRGGGRGAIACVPTIPIPELTNHEASLPACRTVSALLSVPYTLSPFFSDSCKLFCTFLHSFAFGKNSTHLFSNSSALFAKKTGVQPQPQTRLRHLTDEAEANEDRAAMLVLGCGRFPQCSYQRPWPGQFSQSGLTSLHSCPDVVQLFGPYRPGKLIRPRQPVQPNQTRRVVS